jgi:Kef-type K+ transport system membrane component KefB
MSPVVTDCNAAPAFLTSVLASVLNPFSYLPPISLPLANPIAAFTVVLAVMLLAPLLFNRLRMPGIVGLILSGVALGPYGFNLIDQQQIALFSKAGLLYIMFLAGLELNMQQFRAQRTQSIVFGLLTFSVPFGLGLVVCTQVLHFEWLSSVLISSMFSTHTLVAYPLISRMGLTRHQIVTVAVGGTILTDTLVLLMLPIITQMKAEGPGALFWIWLVLRLTLFAFLVFRGIPPLMKWFLRKSDVGPYTSYLMVLTLIFAGGLGAELAGVEGIIGAFFTGLALNRLIAHGSPLMSRIDFAGNALFIPFFLIGVGMLVDVRVLFRGPEALWIALVLSLAALVGKWLAARATGFLFRYNPFQRRLLFGLSTAHAAATVAVILIGYQIGLVNLDVLNGTIILVLCTSVISSFVVERNARILAQQAPTAADFLLAEKESLDESIMVALSNPASAPPLLDLAMACQNPQLPGNLFAISVVTDNDPNSSSTLRAKRLLLEADRQAGSRGRNLEKILRFDLNIASGIVHAAREKESNEIILGWNPDPQFLEKFWGGILPSILRQSNQQILIQRGVIQLTNYKGLTVWVPAYLPLEPGFLLGLRTIQHLHAAIGGELTWLVGENEAAMLRRLHDNNLIEIPGRLHVLTGEMAATQLRRDFLQESERSNHLPLLVCPREGSLSFAPLYTELPDLLGHLDLLLLYPRVPPTDHVQRLNSIENPLPAALRRQMERLQSAADALKDWLPPLGKGS